MGDRFSDRATDVRFLLSDDADGGAPALVDAATGETWNQRELRLSVDDKARRFAAPAKALAFCLCQNDGSTIIRYLAASEAGHAVLLLDGATPSTVLDDLVSRYRPELVLG